MSAKLTLDTHSISQYLSICFLSFTGKTINYKLTRVEENLPNEICGNLAELAIFNAIKISEYIFSTLVAWFP